jgi:hypothetical protein
MSIGRAPAAELRLAILGLHVRVQCSDPKVKRFIGANFAAMVTADEAFCADLEYSVEYNEGASFSIHRPEQPALEGAGSDDLLFLLEKEITVALQKRRPDLLFLHSAAIEWLGKAYLLAAEGGRGKSTATWALLHHDFAYLTDELAPVDLQSLQVFPYPHALCLKRAPAAYPLPEQAIHLGRTIHVPTSALPSRTICEPRPLGAVFLVSHRPDLSAPSVYAISPAEASARLYVTALNSLAHPGHGLDAVLRLARQVPCFAVCSGNLPATCALIRCAVEQAIRNPLRDSGLRARSASKRALSDGNINCG